MFTRTQRLTLVVLVGAGFMGSVDFSILNVALPEAGAGVGMRTAVLPWITSAYTLPVAGFTLLFGRVGDLYGRRRVFLAGMVVLLLGSLVGGLATTPGMLLAGRALQGLATAMSIPAGLSLLTTTFAEGPLRDRVLGLNGALLSAGFSVGALVGGALVSVLGWRAAFLVNVPVAVLIFAVTPFIVRESSVPRRARLDLPGAVTVSGGLLALTYAVVESHLLAGAVGAGLLVAFWVVEKRAPAPLAPTSVLTRPTVLWGNVGGCVATAMVPGLIFLTTLYLQEVLGLSPFASGLVFGVPGLVSVAAGVVAGRLIGRLGSRLVLVAGLVVTAVSTGPLVLLGESRSWLVLLVPALMVCFFGLVAVIVAYTVTATSGLPDEEQGLATGLTTMTQQASTIGIPLLAAIAASQPVLLTGIRLALLVDVAITLAGAALVLVALRPRAGVREAPTGSPAEAGRLAA